MVPYDLSNLDHLKAMASHAPAAMKAFQSLNDSALADGAIPAKYKELMAVAVAVTTQCPYCIEVHAVKARSLGATDAELTEATLVAAALRAGGAVTHGVHALVAGGK